MEAQLGTQKRRGLGGQSSLNPFEGAPAHFVGGVSDFIRSPISGGQKPNICVLGYVRTSANGVCV